MSSTRSAVAVGQFSISRSSARGEDHKKRGASRLAGGDVVSCTVHCTCGADKGRRGEVAAVSRKGSVESSPVIVWQRSHRSSVSVLSWLADLGFAGASELHFLIFTDRILFWHLSGASSRQPRRW